MAALIVFGYGPGISHAQPSDSGARVTPWHWPAGTLRGSPKGPAG